MAPMRGPLLIALCSLFIAPAAWASPQDCDDDADGYQDTACGGPDCDDTDPTAYPGAPELCDGLDTDCDGVPDENDPHAGATQVLFEDFDVSAGGFTSNAGPASSFVWERGTPTFGPDFAFSGDQVWATILAGPYAAADNAGWLDTPLYTLPGGGQLELSFAYWQDNEGACDAGDYTSLELYTSAGGYAPIDNGDACTGALADTDGAWLIATYDLTDWVGTEVWFRVSHDTDSADNSFAGTYIDDLTITQLNDFDGDGWSGCGDCVDTDPSINPGAAEVCDDGVDNDCDGVAEDTDGDGDTHVNVACGGLDCDDGDAAIYPGATETCDDATDSDCDGDDPASDVDGDGVANATCGGTDCDDDAATTYPGAPELCNDGVDNDCDAATVDLFDTDGDGYMCDVDCADSDATINPGAAEVECDGADNDCDPSTVGDPDQDGDGSVCGLDCDDDDPTRSPWFNEVCNDGIDNDCNPSTPDVGDFDFDGWGCLVDCDDFDAAVYPGAPEVCNDGVDQDCDLVIDELVDESITLDDDGAATVSLCSFSFPFCDQEWDQVHVQANGRVTFGFDEPSSSALGFFFVQQVPEIAALWADLDPEAGGQINVFEDDGVGFEVTWDAVPLAGDPASSNTVTLTLLPDGTASVDYGAVDALPSLVGWACGAGDIETLDISAFQPGPSALGIGTGTEEALYEEFSDPDNPLDLSDLGFDFCINGGGDGDEDGWTDLCGDCDDSDAAIFPGAEEVCDATDQDCDGVADEIDGDGDGFQDAACGGDDCNDMDPATHPGAEELCNGLDDDCDGNPEILDADGDDYYNCEDDCDDNDATINPGMTESCNQIDDDCDGHVDEGFFPDGDEDGFISDECAGTDCDDEAAEVHPDAEEICNEGVDDDCDGSADDVDFDLDGFVTDDCNGPDCDDDDPLINPDVVEVPYDGVDNDCDGIEEIDVDGDGFVGLDAGGDDCDDERPGIHPDAIEVCDDEIDNNCNALLDSDDPSCRGCGCQQAVTGPAGSPTSGLALLLLLGALGIRRHRRSVA
jgi:MYXO-CTERM domain-containing protein